MAKQPEQTLEEVQEEQVTGHPLQVLVGESGNVPLEQLAAATQVWVLESRKCRAVRAEE